MHFISPRAIAVSTTQMDLHLNIFIQLWGWSYKKHPIYICINTNRYAEEIEDIFSPSIFAQLMSSVIIMCTTGFLLINVTSEPLEIFSTIGYLIAMAVQILFFCWRGNEIIYSVCKHYRSILISFKPSWNSGSDCFDVRFQLQLQFRF